MISSKEINIINIDINLIIVEIENKEISIYIK